METTESCKLCEKIVITMESKKNIDRLLDIPNTFDPSTRSFSWKFHEFFAYALIPRVTQGATSLIDLYLCMDEDVLDDIDVLGYAKRFMQEQIFSKWKNFKGAHFMEPTLTLPEGLVCRKLRHFIKKDPD